MKITEYLEWSLFQTLVKLYDKEVEKILEIRKDNGLSLPSVDDMKSSHTDINQNKK